MAHIPEQIHRSSFSSTKSTKVLSNTENLAECTTAEVGEISKWTAFVNSAEENRSNFCEVLDEKPLFSALYGMDTVTLNELKAVL
jgi:hypothetical protein